MVVGFLATGLGLGLIYSKIRPVVFGETQRLPLMTQEIGRAVGTQSAAVVDMSRKIDNNSVTQAAAMAVMARRINTISGAMAKLQMTKVQTDDSE